MSAMMQVFPPGVDMAPVSAVVDAAMASSHILRTGVCVPGAPVPVPLARPVVEQILRFTAWTIDASTAGSAAVVQSVACSPGLMLSRAQMASWCSRFGDTDAAALTAAAALFMLTEDGRMLLRPWYHSTLHPTAGSAQAYLSGQPAGTFLLRVSTSAPGSFALSYVTADTCVKHTRVHRVREGYIVDGSTTPMPHLEAVINLLPHVLVRPIGSVLSDASAASAPVITPAPAPAAAMEANYASMPPATYSAAAYDTLMPGGAAATGATPAGGVPMLRAPSVSTPVVPPAGALARAGSTDQYDVMLSYQWDDQPTVRRIRDTLVAEGITVWMDENNMTAAYVTSMVKAVKQARCIVLCTSNKYIKSANCETEARLVYEHAREKAYIILNMESGFYPGRVEHVVAALAAGKLYCDFSQAASSDDAFKKGMDALRKQLGEHSIFPTRSPSSARPMGSPASFFVSAPAPAPASDASSAYTMVPAPATASLASGYEAL